MVPVAKLQAGGREHCAKQKAFGTVLATAPSPASYTAPKKPLGPFGGLFRRLPGRGGEEMAGGVSTRPGLARCIVLDIHRPSHGSAEGAAQESRECGDALRFLHS